MPHAPALIALAMLAVPPVHLFFQPVTPPRPFQVMAHRGAMQRAPENSKAAIEGSIEDGAEWVEVDVRLTKDGHHVLFHDARLDRASTGKGPLKDQTLEQLKALDIGSPFARRFAGTRILTLAEALTLAKGRVNLYLDLKDHDPARLAREVLEAGMETQTILYDSPARLAEIRKAHPKAERLALMTKWRPGMDPARLVAENHLAAVEIDEDQITPEVIAAFRRLNVKVQAKALGGSHDTPEVWDRLQALGVDWIQTNHADEIVARFRRKRAREMGRDRLKIALHRGASLHAPENTIASLKKAAALDADLVEFDIQTTRDGRFVVLHDGSLDRTTDGKGRVRDRDWNEIQGLDAGSWFGRSFAGERVPSLETYLDAVPPGIELYVDAKDITPGALAEILRRKRLNTRSVVYQSAEYLERLGAIAPEIRRMPPLRKADDIEALAARVRPYAFDARWSILSKPLIDRCHALGIRVFSDALGPNESVASYRRAIAAGIDAIQTDHPSLVGAAIADPF